MARGIDFARKRIIMAAKASHIDVIDTVFPDVNDEEGLRKETEYAKKIGFTGKAVINPRQIDIVHEVFTPTEEEIRKRIALSRSSGPIVLLVLAFLPSMARWLMHPSSPGQNIC